MGMGCNQHIAPNPSDNPPIESIIGIEAVRVCARPATDLKAVELRVADDRGTGFEVLLDPDSAFALAGRLYQAASEVAGTDRDNRRTEAMRLLNALIEVRGRQASWVARELGVGNSTVHLWRYGKEPPTAARLAELRALARRGLRYD